jgi:hypothetical protein
MIPKKTFNWGFSVFFLAANWTSAIQVFPLQYPRAFKVANIHEHDIDFNHKHSRTWDQFSIISQNLYWIYKKQKDTKWNAWYHGTACPHTPNQIWKLLQMSWTTYRNSYKCREQSGQAANKKMIHQLLIVVPKKQPSGAHVGAWRYSYSILDSGTRWWQVSSMLQPVSPGGRKLGEPLGLLKHKSEGKNI